MKITVSRPSLARQRRVYRMRLSLTVCALTLFLQLGARSAWAADVLDRYITIDIPANTSLEEALLKWGTMAKVTVMINTATVERQLSEKVKGTLSARNALNAILHESGLTYTQEDDRIRIVPRSTLVRSALRELTVGADVGAKFHRRNANSRIQRDYRRERCRGRPGWRALQ